MNHTTRNAMGHALDLVMGQKLAEATALIQAGLRPHGAPAAAAPALEGASIELKAEKTNRGASERAAPAAPRQRRRFPVPGLSGAFGASERAAAPVAPGAEFLSLRYTGPAGSRAYRLYVPATTDERPMPLLVMLHGCTQNPEDFATGTRMNQLADERKMLVAYPEQERSSNANLCWNWFEPGHQRRGAGDPAVLAGIVAEIAASQRVDRARVFVAGLSAGGAMAAVLGSTYGDVFAAVGVHSGLPHGAAADVASALSVMRSGKAMGSSAPRGAHAIVFHGAGDRTVHPSNGARAAGLGEAHDGFAKATTGTVNGRSYSRSVRPARNGAPAVEHWLVEGLGHAWSGGDASGSYADPIGPDASREMMRFFLEQPSGT